MTRRKTASDQAARVEELEGRLETVKAESDERYQALLRRLDDECNAHVDLVDDIVRELEPVLGKTPSGLVVNAVREVVAAVVALRSQVASLQFPADVDDEIDTPDFSSLADEAPVLRGVSIAALESLRSTVVTSSRDWSGTRGDAWIYGLVVGWDDWLPGIAAALGWSAETVERLRELHEAFADASDDAEIAAG